MQSSREVRDWSQVELAEKIGISRQVVNDMEHGRRPISGKVAKRLAEVFGVRADSFL